MIATVGRKDFTGKELYSFTNRSSFDIWLHSSLVSLSHAMDFYSEDIAFDKYISNVFEIGIVQLIRFLLSTNKTVIRNESPFP